MPRHRAERDEPLSTSACTCTSAGCSFLSSVCSMRIESVRIRGRPALMSPAICREKTASDRALTCFVPPGQLDVAVQPRLGLERHLEGREPLRLQLAGDGRLGRRLDDALHDAAATRVDRTVLELLHDGHVSALRSRLDGRAEPRSHAQACADRRIRSSAARRAPAGATRRRAATMPRRRGPARAHGHRRDCADRPRTSGRRSARSFPLRRGDAGPDRACACPRTSPPASRSTAERSDPRGSCSRRREC